MIHAHKSQKGATLFIALIMLLMLTLLAVNSMQDVTLENRITASHGQTLQLSNIADAALREAEFRFYGSANLTDKLEPSASNCSTENTLNSNGLNKPCLLAINSENLLSFVDSPWLIDSSFLDSASSGGLTWMPYRGTDYSQTSSASSNSTGKWNSILISEDTNTAINAEYGMVAEGKGTYYYLNNGNADEDFFLQSTHSNIYLGINN